MPQSVEMARGANPLEDLQSVVHKLGRYGEGLLESHRLGIPRAVFRRHIAGVEGLLGQLGADGACPLTPVGGQGIQGGSKAWNYAQSVQYAAGAAMITQRFQRGIPRPDLPRAMAANILYELEANILDDLVDNGRYGFREAGAIFHLGFTSLINPNFDSDDFREELSLRLRPEQLHMIETMTHLTASFNGLLWGARSTPELFPVISAVTDCVVLAQSLTIFQAQGSLDLRKIREASSAFAAPDADVRWHERLASHVSHVTNHTLFDMCFAEEPLAGEELEAHLEAWYYYNISITQINNIVDLQQDLGEGLINLALISMREGEVLDMADAGGYDPGLTIEDYERQLARTAVFFRRALIKAQGSGEDAGMFYPFITVMIPAVMMAPWREHGDHMLHFLVDCIDPSVRAASTSLCGSPKGMKRMMPVTTLPSTRSGRRLGSRSGSSRPCQ